MGNDLKLRRWRYEDCLLLHRWRLHPDIRRWAGDQSEISLYQEISPTEFLFQGRIDLEDFNEVVGTHLTREVADTLGGYLYGQIGRVPAGGEHVQVENWDLTVEQVTGRRIRTVRARRLPEKSGEEEETDGIE